MMSPKTIQTIKTFLAGLAITLYALPAKCQTYITNVSVIDVETHRILPAQTVVIQNGIITNIQPVKKIKVPEKAIVIDGTGKFLMPGMMDAHVHFFQSGGLYARPDAINLTENRPYTNEIAWVHHNMDDALRRYMQAGVTSVMDVGATRSFLKQRDTFANKSYVPAIYMTGPLLTTWEPPAYEHLGEDEPFNLITSIEDAKKKVQEQLPYKPDFIKIWYITKRDSAGVEASARKNAPMIKAVIDEAHAHHLKVAVHATERITAQLAVENGCDFLVHSVDDEIVTNDFIQLLKTHKTILCPTLVVHDGYAKTFGQYHAFSYYELTHSNPVQLGSLLDLKHITDTAKVHTYYNRFNATATRARFHLMDSISMVNLKRLADAGVLIAAGTDAGNIGTLHASSYLNELQAMQHSGLSNWQVLEAATINGARILGHEARYGSLAAGKQATMLLLNANPVDSLSNLTAINLIINKGVVVKPENLITETPEALAQRQLNAYNMHNLDAFLEPYAEDVEIYTYPDTLEGKGKRFMHSQYAYLFNRCPNLHCELVSRIVQGNVVIDKERVTGFRNNTVLDATAIYHIKDNKISKVYFIR